MSGQFLSEAIREPVSERVLVRLASASREGVYRPALARGITRASLLVNLARALTRALVQETAHNKIAHRVRALMNETSRMWCLSKGGLVFATLRRSRNGRDARIVVLRRRTARRQLTALFGERFCQGEAPRKPHAIIPSWKRMRRRMRPCAIGNRIEGVGAERGGAGVRISRRYCLVERASSRRRMPVRLSE